MSDPLEIEAVTAGYDGRPVVDGLTLSVGPGEVVGLIGPNGSGKTTLVRVASRALRPLAGSVRLAGRDPYAIPARVAARLVAVVPQELAPTFSFTALEVVLMGRSPYLPAWGGGGPDDYRSAREAMEAAGVHHLADRPLEELSGGEKQGVVLAQALAQDAPLLLLDEPTTHLDLRHVVSVLEIVLGLAREERKAVLAVFHDLNLASAFCDRLVALDRGRVVAEGSPEDVVDRALLEDVYGVDAEITPHFVSGRPTVMLGPPLAPAPRGAFPRAHVVGGAGRGAPAMRGLAARGFEVTAGVLHAQDTDALIAERLNLERVVIPPFSEVDEEARREILALMRRAAVVVVCDAPYGPGNIGNLFAAELVAREGGKVCLLDRVPIEERDFTEGEATRLWRGLRERALVARSYEELLAAAAPPG